MERKSLFILLGILLLGLTLRVFKLQEVPMYGDELTLVTDSYSLLHTGLDQTGKPWPLTFSMGAGRPAGYVYATIASVALFGPTVWGVRAVSILSSLGIILLVFFLGKKLFGEKVGLWASFLVAISPWDINLGRGGFEAHFALLLALWGTYLLLEVREKRLNLLWTALIWGLCVNTYPTYKLVLPIFLPVVIWYLGGIRTFLSGNKWILITTGIVSLGIIGITLAQTFWGGSENRFDNINVFSANLTAVVQDINFNRMADSGNKIIAPFFYNKPVEYFNLLKDSYLKDFSLDYLVISGDGNPRHNMTTSGVIYLVELVTIVAALKVLVENREKRKDLILIMAWLLIAPLAAVLTIENHALRTNFMLPPLVLLSAVGFVAIVGYNKKFLTWGLIALWVVQFVPMMEQLYFLAPNRFARFWSNMAKVVSTKVAQSKSNYDYVIVSTNIDNVEYAYPIYNQIDPKEIIANNQNKIKLDGTSFKKYGNVYLGTIPTEHLVSFLNNLPGKVMYIGPYTEANLLGSYNVLYDKDKVPSAIIYFTETK
jgi:4-amino-4-deoxy-L-arabinose transferase-like glycosyltransferase